MTDFLEEKKSEISARLDELRPAVEEFRKLEAALSALDGVEAPRGGGGGQRGSGGGGSRSGGSSNGGGGRRGRPKGSGTRANEALDLVKSKPGITIPEMALQMGIQQNYLYRVLPSLEQEGQVHKDGRGWFPKDAA